MAVTIDQIEIEPAPAAAPRPENAAPPPPPDPRELERAVQSLHARRERVRAH